MPELLTKHPEVAIQVLEGGRARCGPGQEQTILKQCPPERFCSTSSGELCVFGLDELPKMTQISRAEICETKGTQSSACAMTLAAPEWPAATLALALGAFFLRRSWRRRA